MWYDALILALLVFCTIRGAAKGFAWQIATIGAIVLCFVFAESGSLALAPLIKLDPPLNRWVAMFVLYIGASFVSFAAARAIRSTLEKWQFVEYDKHLGAIFGFIKGTAFALVITFFVITLSKSMRSQVLASYSGYSAGHLLSAIHPVLPDEFHGIVDPYLERLGYDVVHEHGDHVPDSDLRDDFGRPPLLSTNPLQSPDGTAGQGETPADFGSAPSDFGPIPEWPGRSQSTSTSQQTSLDLQSLVADIPDDLKQSALTALKNTKPEHREELLAAFRTAIPGLIKAISMEWEDGRPADADQMTRQSAMLREIAAIYTTNLSAQDNIIRQAEAQLSGVPESVSEVVVQDWYADLLRLDAEDPDPQTDLSTRLDVRIHRQLAAFGISPDSLSQDLRTRLGSVRR